MAKECPGCSLRSPVVPAPSDPTMLIRIMLQGGRSVVTDAQLTLTTMPAYRWKLTDEQIAAALTFVWNQWGNVAKPVETGDVTSHTRIPAELQPDRLVSVRHCRGYGVVVDRADQCVRK